MTVGGLATLLASGRNVILLPFLTRGLTIEDYGVWVQAVALVELLGSTSVIALSSALARFASVATERAAAARGFWTSMVTSVVIGSCLALVMTSQSRWISRILFHTEDYQLLVLTAAALIPLTACERLLLSFFHARLQVVRHALCLLVESVLYVGLAIWMVQRGGQAAGILGVLMAARTTVLVGGSVLAAKDIGAASPDFAVLRQYLRFGMPLIGVSLFAWVTGLSDRYVINWFHGPALVGAYSVAYTLGMLTAMLFSPLFSVLTPTLVPMWEQGDTYGVFRHLYHIIRYSIAGILPFVVGVTMLAEPIMRVVATEQYVTSRATVGFVAAGILFLMLSGVLEPVVALIRKTATSAVVYGVVAVTNLAVNFALVPDLGALGAAVGTCIAFFVQLCAFYIYLRRHGVAVSLDLLLIAKCLISCTAMVWMLERIEVLGILDLLLAGVSGGAIYIAGLICLRAFSREEMRNWRRLLQPGRD